MQKRSGGLSCAKSVLLVVIAISLVGANRSCDTTIYGLTALKYSSGLSGSTTNRNNPPVSTSVPGIVGNRFVVD